MLHFQTPCTPGSFSRDFSQVQESQERELESRRSSMMTMEILLTELTAERAAKNEEIQRIKVYVWKAKAESSYYIFKVNRPSIFTIWLLCF